MDIFCHELNSYRVEINKLRKEHENLIHTLDEIENTTHYTLGIYNRASLLVIGLCSLIEVALYEIASQEEKISSFKIEDLKGNGLKRLQKYISRTGKIEFGKIKSWQKFLAIYDLRNSIVHSYGGLIETSFLKKTEVALKTLNIESALVGGRRIRLTPENLLSIHELIENAVQEIKEST